MEKEANLILNKHQTQLDELENDYKDLKSALDAAKRAALDQSARIETIETLAATAQQQANQFKRKRDRLVVALKSEFRAAGVSDKIADKVWREYWAPRSAEIQWN